MVLELDERTLYDVNRSIDLLADHLDAGTLPRPKVETCTDEHSSFNRLTKVIQIRPEEIDYGPGYFHEAAHYFRTALNPEMDSTVGPIVDEFFGRLGDSMGRKLTENTDYERLFSNHPEIDSSNLEGYKHILKAFVKKHNLHDAAEYQKGFEKSLDLLSNVVESARTVNNIVRQFTVDHVSEYDSIYENAYNRLKFSLMNSDLKVSPEWCEYIAEFELIKGKLDSLRTHIQEYQHDNNKDEQSKAIVAEGRELVESVQKLNTIVHDLHDQTFKQSLDIITADLLSIHEHKIGYSAAELYVSSGADFMQESPQLFRQSDKAIYDAYITDSFRQQFEDVRQQVLFDACPGMEQCTDMVILYRKQLLNGLNK